MNQRVRCSYTTIKKGGNMFYRILCKMVQKQKKSVREINSVPVIHLYSIPIVDDYNKRNIIVPLLLNRKNYIILIQIAKRSQRILMMTIIYNAQKQILQLILIQRADRLVTRANMMALFFYLNVQRVGLYYYRRLYYRILYYQQGIKKY